MGERKVINKYFPPDFDPTKIPRQDKRVTEKLKEKFVVRMMLPMSVRCQTCGEYMYKGKKFNSRKQTVEGPEGQYLGIQIFRFYFKCITCSAEFTIKTDPERMDYTCEGGAKANYELYKEEKKEKDEIAAEREDGEKYDAMKKLENKTEESKRAMDVLDALDEIRTHNARAESLGIDAVLDARSQVEASTEAQAASAAEAEDEAEAAAVFAAARTKRLRDDDDDADEGEGSCSLLPRGSSTGAASSSAAGSSSAASSSAAATATLSKAAAAKKPRLPAGIVLQAKPKQAAPPAAPPPAAPPTSAGSGGGGLLGLGAYGSSGSGSDSPDGSGGA